MGHYSDTILRMSKKKVAIVTGNFKGLGKAISEKLIQEGYQEPEIIRSKDFDLTKEEDCKKLIQKTTEKYGRLDLLVNNVGDYINKNISDFKAIDWKYLFDSNLNSAFYLSQLSIPELRKTKGRILNIGYASMEKSDPYINVTAYHAAKAALLVYTKGLAKSEAPNGVLINMLSPGYLENSVEFPSEGVEKGIPLKRACRLEEASEAAYFLINSNYITGQNLEIAGGWGL